jgi:hypothetical protein
MRSIKALDIDINLMRIGPDKPDSLETVSTDEVIMH